MSEETQKPSLMVEVLPVAALRPYERNTRKHQKDDVEAICESIRRYGFNDPIGIWGDENLIVEGHGRLMAAQKLGMESVPCIRLDHLTERQRREYAIAHNGTAELSAWDAPMLAAELPALDMAAFPFRYPAHFWGDTKGKDTAEYQEFVEKFEPKLTTDDCYTPPAVYEAVKNWVVREYGLESAEIVRPFYPGGDYQNASYPAACVVIDNPPFSILSEIVRWYMSRKIPFFLFAPSLTLFSIAGGECNYLPVACDVVFENGAKIGISFVTSLGAYKIDTAPELYRLVSEADRSGRDIPPELPTYKYPDTVLLSNTLARAARYAGRVQIREARFIRKLESQATESKALYGGGFLIGQKAAEKAAAEKAAAEKAAAEKAAAEKAAAEKAAKFWPLSEAEQTIIDSLED